MASASDPAKLLAIGLLNFADDEGYFYANVILIRNSLRPMDESTVSTHGALTELHRMGYVELCENPSHGQIGRIPAFLEHQVINRPSGSKIKHLWIQGGLTEPSQQIHPGREGKGVEGKGKDTPKPPRGTSGSQPTLEMIRIGKIHKRLPGTKWSEKEVKAFKSIRFDVEEVELVEEFYLAKETPGNPLFRRTSLLTHLNNWQGEVDKARSWKGTTKHVGISEDIDIPT